ncbi:MAG TPA: hypothetical protein VIP11_08925 [Gemmatimonadaceae bacterium]
MSFRIAALSAAFFVGSLTPAGAQLVTPKTVPVRQDNQFAIFPSQRSGMADVGIALDDTLLDPWVNPAKITRIARSSVYVLPFSHDVTSGTGGGLTLPVGGYVTRGSWSGGTVFAIQQLDTDRGFAFEDPSVSNKYAAAVVGRRLGNGLSLGGSGYVGGLGALDGVDILYQGTDRLLQSGSLADFRLGMTKEWGRKRLDAVVLHNRTNIAQDVHYPSRTILGPGGPTSTAARDDHNIDKTIIWGAHTQYAQAIGDQGWRIGAIAKANRLSHPKIPNYQIQNIPRDPGTTWGFNVGVGVGRTVGATSFGIDLIAEPMYSTTWGTADRGTSGSGGGSVRADGHTVDNYFKFSNTHVRAGIGHDFVHTDSGSVLGFQFGLSAYSINYRLHQVDHVQPNTRWINEGWTEWSPTFGLRWQTKDFEFLYNVRFTCGPSDCLPTGDKITVPGISTGGVIAAPSSRLTIDGGTARISRFQLSIPVR